MNRTVKAIFWIIVFFCCLLAVDQFLLRVEFRSGGMQAARVFYLDFRQRLFGLGGSPAPASVESIISEKEAAPPATNRDAATPRYLYADENGQLQFADSMEEIPPRFRKGAQRLDE